MAFQPLVNGTAYSWSQIDLILFGTPVAGVTKVSYKEKQEMQNNYGARNSPVSRGYGKKEPEASITLEMAEVEALQAAIASGNLQDIAEFDIVVSYIPEGSEIRTHTLHNCKFMENGRDVSSGDMTIEVELPLLISHISWK